MAKVTKTAKKADSADYRSMNEVNSLVTGFMKKVFTTPKSKVMESIKKDKEARKLAKTKKS